MSIVRPLLLAPSILSADFAELGEEVRRVERGGADLIHVDVMDGRFVPPLTFGAPVVRALRKVTRLPIHAHLMVEQPEHLISDFVAAGTGLITVHVETCPHLHRTLGMIRELGARPSVTLNPATPLGALEYVLDKVDLVLVMTVDPGYGGQRMIPAMLDKVRQLRAMIDRRGVDVQIEVDGGINEETMFDAVAAGADVLVMGSALYGAMDGPEEATRRVRRSLVNA